MRTVIEPQTFLADVRSVGMTEAEHNRIIDHIAADPRIGELMEGTGGARKVRFAGRGKGKSGGYRVIFYSGPPDVPLLMLAVFGKGEKDNLTKAERNELRIELAGFTSDYRASAKRKTPARRLRSR